MCQRFLESHEYEDYIEDRVEQVLNNLLYIPKTTEHEKLSKEEQEKHNNYLKEGIKEIVAHLIEHGQLDL